ncbi:glycoside hydrolase domain-containing protein [Bacillus timonensis]|uniref:glycoside hydrolase domain-containing protein n=1 Tax=Bacillus timonensis TaxID=1033734 RepID=UPI000287E71E|nr:glycoside hydrolase domain-containing protein [Bacillus timonensis]
MTEKGFNIMISAVIGFLLCCAVYFYVTEDKTKPVTSTPTTEAPPTPPPANTKEENKPPPANEQDNKNQEKDHEKNQNNEKNQQKEEDKNKDENSQQKEEDKNKEENSQQKEEDKNNEKAKPSDKLPEIVWGIDSASETTKDFYACVKDNFGDPVVFGRYLGERDGISVGLTAEQVKIIHAEGDFILPIYNHFNDATGYDNGVAYAKEAIQLAADIGIPQGVAIFADIEPDYPVDSEFIKGWFDTIEESNFKSGIYGVFDPEQALFKAYQKAGESNGAILEKNYIWTAAPSIGITAETKAPEFQPSAPEGALAWGWQYGIDSETCNIDTNLFKRELVDVLWGP